MKYAALLLTLVFGVQLPLISLLAVVDDGEGGPFGIIAPSYTTVTRRNARSTSHVTLTGRVWATTAMKPFCWQISP